MNYLVEELEDNQRENQKMVIIIVIKDHVKDVKI